MLVFYEKSKKMKLSIIVLFFGMVLSLGVNAQIVMRPADAGFQMFLGTDTDRPAVFGADNNEVMIIAPPYGNIGVSTSFYTGNTLNYPTHAKFHIRARSSGDNEGSGQGPQLLLDENSTGGYSRLRFRNSRLVTTGYDKYGSEITELQPYGRYWDFAAFGNGASESNDRLNLFHSGFGNAMTILGNGWVGINNTSPETRLDVNGYTKTGGESTAYKTKLVNVQETGSCSSGAEQSIALGVAESRVISVDVLVKNGSGDWYGPGDRYNNHEYSYRVDGSNLEFNFASVSGCDFVIRSFRIWVTYSSTNLTY